MSDVVNVQGLGLTVLGSLLVSDSDRPRWLEQARDLVEASHQEEGIVAYAMAADVVEPGRIVFHERYRDLDALAAHRDSDHYRRFLRSVRDIEIIEGPTLMSYFDGQPCDIGPSSLAR